MAAQTSLKKRTGRFFTPHPLRWVVVSFVFLWLFLEVPEGWGTTYYVDATTGSDTYSGTSPSLSWKTISKVNGSRFNPGDQILFKRGELWREQLAVPSSGLEGNLITFGAYGGGDPPVMSGANRVAEWTPYSGNLWQASVPTQPHVVIFDSAKGKKQPSIADVNSERAWYWENQILYVYSTSNPGSRFTNPGIQVGERGACITLHYRRYVRIQDLRLTGANSTTAGMIVFNGALGGSGNHEFLNLTLENGAGSGLVIFSSSQNKVDSCNILEVESYGIHAQSGSEAYRSTQNILSNNTIHGASGPGIFISGFSNSARATGNTAQGNTVFDCGDGIYLTYADNNSVRGNTLYSNARAESFGEGIGIGVCASSNNDISQNVIYGNRTQGIEVWGGTSPWGNSDGNKLFGNSIHSNANAGVLFSSPYANGNEVSYNIVRGNGSSGALLGHETTGNKLYNNTIDGNRSHGIEFFESASGWTLRNNIASNNAGFALNAFGSADFTHDHNCYYLPTGTIVGYNGRTYTASNLADFEPSALGSNPAFVNPAGYDFQLQPTSRCIDSGTAVGLTQDFAGNSVPIGNGVDVGAFEFQARPHVYPPQNLRILSP